jgi:16S rRNA (guanine1516-N2)-methyltransferase
VKEEYFFYKDNILHYKISDKESLSFDFLKGRLFNRLKRIEHESLIKKAIGKNKAQLKIFDATAGSLIDTIIFLKLGHKVVACEQSKILYRLLNDAILRAKKEYDFFDNLSFINSDSAVIIDSYLDSDIFYFDPMFEEVKQNTKRSGTLQKIGNVLSFEKLEDTSAQIFDHMLKKKYKKVIVKRPIKSNSLYEKINYQVKGKAIRYDVYIKT